MKELSIEEKAKRYDEALKVAKDINSGCASYIPDGTPVIKAIFPELKESEDEGIRKELICFLETEIPQCNARDKYIAWLEKQGKNNMGISETTKLELEGNLNKALEKETPESWNEFLEKQGKQILADKIEPKFKVGDWVIGKQGIVHQIANVIENVTNHTYAYDIVGGGYFNDNTEGVRLWTIQDAKKGDILQANKCTLIFDSLTKDIDGNTVISSWYFCDTRKFYGMGPSQSDLWTIKGVVPATKEQCDLLFQKMKEAGYEWNAEKKELNKIEQNLACSEGNLPEFESYLCLMFQKFRTKGMCTNGEIIDYVKEHSQKLKDALCHHWSEEDNDCLNAAINNLEYLKNNYVYHQMGLEPAINWLKSLKDRVQPKQETLEKLEKWLDEYVSDLADVDTSSLICSFTNYLNGKLPKSLRLQNKWKPSEEQMEALKSSTYCQNEQTSKVLFGLYQDLKKLREE